MTALRRAVGIEVDQRRNFRGSAIRSAEATAGEAGERGEENLDSCDDFTTA